MKTNMNANRIVLAMALAVVVAAVLFQACAAKTNVRLGTYSSSPATGYYGYGGYGYNTDGYYDTPVSSSPSPINTTGNPSLTDTVSINERSLNATGINTGKGNGASAAAGSVTAIAMALAVSAVMQLLL